METLVSDTKILEIKKLIGNLGNQSGILRKEARKELVAKGRYAIDFLSELVDHPKHLYRWEAVKTLEGIGDPISIPVLIHALEDDESDVRWIAAEGLIKIGVQSVKPLLKSLIEKSDSGFLPAGVHHVFHDLKKAGKLPANFPVDELLSALNHPGRVEIVKPLAAKLLNKFEL